MRDPAVEILSKVPGIKPVARKRLPVVILTLPPWVVPRASMYVTCTSPGGSSKTSPPRPANPWVVMAVWDWTLRVPPLLPLVLRSPVIMAPGAMRVILPPWSVALVCKDPVLVMLPWVLLRVMLPPLVVMAPV